MPPVITKAEDLYVLIATLMVFVASATYHAASHVQAVAQILNGVI